MLVAYDRGITFIMQAIIFRIVPTALEISLVCGILVRYRLHYVQVDTKYLNL